MGHLTGCGGADPHYSLISASVEHFPHKTEKMPNIYFSDKAAAFHPHNVKAEEIDYFEAVFLLNINEDMLLCWREIFACFGDEPGY